jgi:hypothetical protein
MSGWEITEKLPNFPATLHVNESKWWLSHYYPGPDARYNGYFFKLTDKQVPEYAENLRKSWEKFESIYPSLKSESGVTLAGYGGIEIYINSYGSGISIIKYHGRITNRETVKSYLFDLEEAPKRANILQFRLIGI